VNIKVGCCGSFHHRVKVFCFLDHGSWTLDFARLV
jgi:hypothetical protein